jgi:hypothetical protein
MDELRLQPMTLLEARQLDQRIKNNLKAFIDVGMGLADMWKRKGYEILGYKTFEQYANIELGLSRTSSYEYIGASSVAQAISARADIPNLDFSHARELARLATPSNDGDRRKKEIDIEAVKKVASSLDFTQATVKDVAKAVDAELGKQRSSTVTYLNQPAIHATRGTVPLAGTSHLYTVNKLLWPEEVESLLSSLLIGRSLHLCCGKSKLGTVRLDLFEEDADIRADAAHTGLADKSFDSVLCDPPYNGEFQWNHDLLTELGRLACQRIIFQHWFLPCDPDGQYKKANYFKLSAIYVWQPRTYFGRAQIISIFDA